VVVEKTDKPVRVEVQQELGGEYARESDVQLVQGDPDISLRAIVVGQTGIQLSLSCVDNKILQNFFVRSRIQV
jgi:hypothetical protein